MLVNDGAPELGLAADERLRALSVSRQRQDTGNMARAIGPFYVASQGFEAIASLDALPRFVAQNGCWKPNQNCTPVSWFRHLAMSKRRMLRSTKPNQATSRRRPQPTPWATGPWEWLFT